MKKILPISFLLIFFTSYCIIDKNPINVLEYYQEEDYKIYNIFLDSLYIDSSTVLLLSDFTIPHYKPTSYSDLNQYIPSLKEETYYNYQEINTKSIKLKPVQNIFAKCYIISADEKNDWKTLYPDANVLIQFSRIGYNSLRNQALLYFVEHHTPLASTGILILFEKEDNWIIKQIFVIWIS
jgi:hypothetical protein